MEKIPIVEGVPVIDTMGAAFEPFDKLYIVQKFSILEGISQGICEIPNTYTIYGGENDEDGVPLFVATETGETLDRCCCAPGHSFILEVMPHDNTDHVIMSLEREGCTCPGLCFTSPKPLLCCFACNESCTDAVKIHDGKISGKVGEIEAPRVVGMIRQPDGGGGFTPTLHVFPGEDGHLKATPSAVIEGPCCFGGCSELCVDSSFPISRAPGKAGDVGEIKHLRPRNISDALAECCTDTDKFSVEFRPGVTGEEKAHLFAATMLMDYMFFEQDNGMCSYRDEALHITCFECYIYGCLCPCTITLSGKNSGGEG